VEVKVVLLRRRGRRLKFRDAENSQAFEGRIVSSVIHTTTEIIEVVSMRTGTPADDHKKLPPDLYNAVFTGVGQDVFCLRGYEVVNECAYAQEWRIHPRPMKNDWPYHAGMRVR
jgi:hypothetical protein